MSLTAAVWVGVFAALAILSLGRPVWAVSLYLLTFFAAPHLWWWGDEIPAARYALWTGVVLLLAVPLYLARMKEETGRRFTIVHGAAIVMAVNATLVHFALASHPEISIDNYVELLKYVGLFLLIWAAVQDKRDFRIVLTSIALGAAYIGYEVTINERGYFSAGRLEGVGAPAADSANSLADVMLTMLPLIGCLFIGGTKRARLTVLIAAPLALNVLILCNSRGAFLGLIGAGVAFLMVARGPTRKKAVRALALGTVALYLLLGDPEIFSRFITTFAGSEERDASAASRLQFWQAGLAMLADYPLGDGGGAFKYVHGGKYLAQVAGVDDDRSLHNGYLTEATDWGVQGLFLKLLFMGTALAAAYKTSKLCRHQNRLDDALIGICVFVSGAALLIHCLFGSFLSNEWGYWVAALLVRYSELYGAENAPQAMPAVGFGDVRVVVEDSKRA